MSNFLEHFYFLFPYLDSNYEIWYGDGESYGGWMYGFLILILINVAVSLCYYLIGRSSSAFSTRGKWLAFFGISATLTFFISAITTNYYPFEGIDPIWQAQPDVWIFSLLNGSLYAFVIYLLCSLVFRYLSVHARYTPF